MEVVIVKTASEMSKLAAQMIVDQVNRNPASVLALSTGSTPIGTYREMVKMYQEGKVSFSQAKCLNMDEYIGLGDRHPQGYRHFMEQNLYQYVDFEKSNLFGPCTTSGDPVRAAKEFDQRIEEEGGIDLLLLGIGRDGHVAFNMPENQLSLNTHVQQLSYTTILDNAKFFQNADEVPTQAMTIGMKNIFRSKKMIMLASGENKSEVMKSLIQKTVLDTRLPASLLKLHSDFTVIMDEEAAMLL